MSVESKTIILYVNINFTGNLFFGFGRYYGKVFPESAVFHLFRAPVYARNDFSIFFFTFLANSIAVGTKGSPRFFHSSLVLK